MSLLMQFAVESLKSSPDTEARLQPSLAQAFAETCARFPDRIAVSAGPRQVTYRELDQAASRISAALLVLELPPESIVAIYMDRSIDMVASMLGVIKAGAAYLPIDPGYPPARVLETLTDAAPAAILTDRDRAPAVKDFPGKLLDAAALIAGPAAAASAQNVAPDALAYVIYTSGSTGQPKGVMVTHRNVLRLFEQTQPWFRFDESDVWTMFHSFAFDFSVWEIWGPLLTGGRLVIVPFATSRSPEDFYTLLCDEGVTVLNQTPTAFSMLIHAEQMISQSLALRLVILGGEALNLRSLLPWFARHGDAQPEIVNMYGITETTVHVTYRRIRQADAERENDSLIGEAIPDLALHLLDDGLQPVADGEIGEICIGGAGVARGYLNRPELTAERFIADPFSASGDRLYRSGDLARRRADDEIVYLGRADRQVKINGFRIELGEIEAVLATHPAMAQVCVTTHFEGEAGQRLVAYLVSKNDTADMKSFRAFAEQHLPMQMRPAFYMPLQALPINVNGKVDRNALPAPEQAPMAAAPSADTSPAAKIATVWRRVLQTNNVSDGDNFFDAGGTSLLLVTLRNELQALLGHSIPITVFFEHTTLRSLTSKLTETAQVAASTAPALTRAQQQRESFNRMKSLRSTAR